MDEVKDMGNIIKTEFLKLKRYSVIKAGIIMTVLSPLLSLFYSTANGGQTWTFDYFMQQVMINNCTLFFPIIIALIAGYIITREYTDDTMKNISTIPIPYKQLLSGKLLVLLLLTIIFSLIGCVIALVINIIAGFPGVHFGNLFNMFIRVTGANIGIYISVLPIILLFCCSANYFLGGVALAFIYGYFELYKRASKVVGVCDVRNEIDTEILAYLKSKGYSDKAEEIVYGELCLFLDDSIARMHKQDSKKRKYIIKFSDIVGIMESAIDKEDVRKEYFLKEKIYEYVMQNIEKALNNLCQDECDTSLENCNRICAAKCGYEKMTEIVDYGQFCKLLNPGKVDEWDNELNLVENLSVDKIQSEIYELLYRSDTPEKVTGDNCGIYLQSKYSQAPSKQVIPTFLDLTRGARKERALQSIFQNIINNTDIIDILAGNSITVIPGSYSGTLSQAQITSGWKNSSPNKVGEYYRDIELISAQELKGKFEQNGGNHD